MGYKNPRSGLDVDDVVLSKKNRQARSRKEILTMLNPGFLRKIAYLCCYRSDNGDNISGKFGKILGDIHPCQRKIKFSSYSSS